ncbi:MAG: hypothetical protein AAGE38_04090 [Pseudomonadota bacterium]
MARQVLDNLTPDQWRMLDVAMQRNVDAFEEFLTVSGKLTRVLEVALDGGTIETHVAQHLGAAVGDVEAQMT